MGCYRAAKLTVNRLEQNISKSVSAGENKAWSRVAKTDFVCSTARPLPDLMRRWAGFGHHHQDTRLGTRKLPPMNSTPGNGPPDQEIR